MITLKRINGVYIVTHNGTEYFFDTLPKALFNLNALYKKISRH